MDNNELELNYLHNQLNANNQIKSILQNEISTLLTLVHQKRQWFDQIENNNLELNHKINEINSKGIKSIVKYNE